MMQTRLTAREQRVASREQTIHHVDAESASQVAEAQAAAAASYSHARRDLQQEFTAQKEALLRERQVLEADRYLPYTWLCHRSSHARGEKMRNICQQSHWTLVPRTVTVCLSSSADARPALQATSPDLTKPWAPALDWKHS